MISISSTFSSSNMNAIIAAIREQKTVLRILMTISFLFIWLAVEEEERYDRLFSIRANAEKSMKDSDRSSFAFVFTIPKDQLPLRKRAEIDLNKSPPRSPSLVSEHPDPQMSPSSSSPVRKRKQDQVYSSSAVSTVPTEREKRKRLSTLKAMRKFRSKWDKKGHEKAKTTLNADEYAKYKERYDHYKRQEVERSKEQYAKNKKLLEQNDPAALERREKLLKRYREYYRNVTKPKKQKKEKGNAAEGGQDKSTPFAKRADPDTRLQIGGDPTPDPPPPEVTAETEKQRRLEAKRKRTRAYNAQFTKKGEEEARRTLPTEEFEKYQARCHNFRAKRLIYAKAGHQRLKAAIQAGDEQASQRYDRQLEMKKKRHEKKKFGTFLSTGLQVRKPGNRKGGDDDTLKALLEQPLDSTTRQDIERRLKRRERGRIDFRKSVIRAKEGDPKSVEWLEKRKKKNREYMHRYRAEKAKTNLDSKSPSASSTD
ncbi:uncharacterized protein FA14DRAFT_19269 [Meira miltonrushii]|uniref:Uncharacterized protein n=1 Tax=Meira miltonrushii TaxID=1280837 RepID=A0A316VJJ3_9BASI|nr:uncharacterized protein FA14DRAFT_19269 [Meira miltonrushii]PWN37792.1 hypothetical protein FA14DRAFT_19269 [Meira miltonrushii]